MGIWFLGEPAGTGRCAGEGELAFVLIHSDSTLPTLAEGVNRQRLVNLTYFVLHRG